MSKGNLLLPLLFLFTSCGPEADTRQQAPEEAAPEWNFSFTCQPLEEAADRPAYGLFASAQEYKVKIADVSACENIRPETYGDLRIPAGTIAAAGGWWAGSGEYFYALPEGDRILIYRGVVDEMQESDIEYEILATYQDGRFSFNE